MSSGTSSPIGPPLASPTSGVIVTGAASGLGLAAAEALAAVGRPVALWDIDTAGCDAATTRLCEVYDVPAFSVGVDLCDPDAIRRAANETRARLPSIGGVVHCAGLGSGATIADFDPAAFDAAMALHVRAVILLVQAVLGDLRAQPGSAIVATASIQARLGDGRLASYTAAKGAVLSLVHALADGLAVDGIRINSVSPGMMRTPMLERALPQGPLRDATIARCMLGRFGEPAEVGRAIRFLLSDEASYVTGTDLLVDGGYLPSARRFTPPDP